MSKSKIICHRANLYNVDSKNENTIESIIKCLNHGFDVEIDVRYVKEKFYLGHDFAQEEIDLKFMQKYKTKLWVHCKDLYSLYELNNTNINHFFHDNDLFTLTSKKFIWTYPKNKVTPRSVIVCQSLQSTKKYLKSNAFKVCTDYALKI